MFQDAYESDHSRTRMPTKPRYDYQHESSDISLPRPKLDENRNPMYPDSRHSRLRVSNRSDLINNQRTGVKLRASVSRERINKDVNKSIENLDYKKSIENLDYNKTNGNIEPRSVSKIRDERNEKRVDKAKPDVNKENNLRYEEYNINKKPIVKEDIPNNTFYFGMNTPSSRMKQEPNIAENNVRKSFKSNNLPEPTSNKFAYKGDKLPTSVPQKESQFFHDLSGRLSRDASLDKLDNKIALEDPGYHSRHNSEIIGAGNNSSDESQVSGIVPFIRPLMPKRFREVPRFSPNAAWKYLGGDSSPTFSKEFEMIKSKETYNPAFDRQLKYPVNARGSCEKSGDSGISGDAESTGPMIEPHDIIEARNIGPVAVSTPVMFSKIGLRNWTPEQDLGEHSLNESADDLDNDNSSSNNKEIKSGIRGDLFDLFNLNRDQINFDDNFDKQNIENVNTSKSEDDFGTGVEDFISSSDWRENWSMARSLPHPQKSSSDYNNSSSRILNASSRSTSSMYLPQYSPPQEAMDKNEPPMYHPQHNSTDVLNRKVSSNNSGNVNSPPVDGKPFFELYRQKMFVDGLDAKPKGKKFSYKSTIRVMEKKKLEEELDQHVQENEKRRLQEAAAQKIVSTIQNNLFPQKKNTFLQNAYNELNVVPQ